MFLQIKKPHHFVKSNAVELWSEEAIYVFALLKKPNQMGIIIESSVLVNLLKAMFELSWQMASLHKKKL